MSLAFADLLVSVLVMPFGAIELIQSDWLFGETFCLVRTSLDVLLTTASILHLCCISLDRYCHWDRLWIHCMSWRERRRRERAGEQERERMIV